MNKNDLRKNDLNPTGNLQNQKHSFRLKSRFSRAFLCFSRLLLNEYGLSLSNSQRMMLVTT